MASNIKILGEWLLLIADFTERKSDLDNLYMVHRYRHQFSGNIHLNLKTQYEKYTCLITVEHTIQQELGKGLGSWWLRYHPDIPEFPYPASHNELREPPPTPPIITGNEHLDYLEIDENGLLPNGSRPMVRTRTVHPGQEIPPDNGLSAYENFRIEQEARITRNRINRSLYNELNPVRGDRRNASNSDHDGVYIAPQTDTLPDQVQDAATMFENNLVIGDDEIIDLRELDHIPDDLNGSQSAHSSPLPELEPDLVIPTYKSENEDDQAFFPEAQLKEFTKHFLAQPEVDRYIERYPVIVIHVRSDMLHSFDLKLLLGYISGKFTRKCVRISLKFPTFGMFFPEYFTQLLDTGLIMGFDFPGVDQLYEQLDLTTIGNKNINGQTSYHFPDLINIVQKVSSIDLSNTGTNKVVAPGLRRLTLYITNTCKNWQLINVLRLFNATNLEQLFLLSHNELYPFESAKYEIDVVKILKLFPKLKLLKIESLLVNVLFEKEKYFTSPLEVLTISTYAADLDFEDWNLKNLKCLHLEKINSKLNNLGQFLSRCHYLEDLRILNCQFIPLLRDIYLKKLRRLILKYYGTESPVFLLSNLKFPNLRDLELTILRTNLSLSNLHAPNLNRLTYNCQHSKKIIDGKIREPVTIADEIHCPRLKWLCYTLGSREEYMELMGTSITSHLTDLFPRYYGEEFIEPDEVFRWSLMLEEKVYPAKYHHFKIFQLNDRY